MHPNTKTAKFKNWKSIIISLSLALLAVVGCTSSGTETAPAEVSEVKVKLKVSGSGSVTPILAAIQPAFEADTPGYQLDVLPGTGTGGGVKGVLQGALDVVAMARPPKDEEAAQNIEFTQIGQAAQAIITHPDVNVTNLTAAQIKALFLGQITNWSEVGGPDLSIILYVRDEGDSSTKVLRQNIVGDTPFPETTANVLTSQSDMLTAVEETPGSVGIATWPTILAKKTDVRAIAMDGIKPGDSTYFMVGPHGIGYLTNRQADVQPLIDWLLSEQGQAALREFEMITNQ